MTEKSSGVTVTERMLAEFCEKSFLKLWSYPNPHKDDGHELCDLLAVFGNHVFIFFDRENELSEDPDKDPKVLWDRWKRTSSTARSRPHTEPSATSAAAGRSFSMRRALSHSPWYLTETQWLSTRSSLPMELRRPASGLRSRISMAAWRSPTWRLMGALLSHSISRSTNGNRFTSLTAITCPSCCESWTR